jgi:ferric-dicitrate binding protein FerR (iron transport regulator)
MDLSEAIPDDPAYDSADWQPVIDSILGREMAMPEPVAPGRIHIIKRLRWVAAAVFIIGLGGAIWLLRHSETAPSQPAIATAKPADVLPGGNKAILTLAGGHQLILDSAANGMLAEQGRVQVVKTREGQLEYHGEDAAILYNTLSTPRGGQYQLRLPDGTQVWLDAASSISYPTFFGGKDRRVRITGQVYFEVARDKARPFQVTVNNMDVEVLGTHFNIKAYSDEASINTTLLEGSVKVSAGNSNTTVLRPGQQAQLSNQLKVVENANPDQVMAWKNGLFNFEGADIKTVMRELGRWYDVEIVYKGEAPHRKFGGEVSRQLTLAQVLRLLQKVGISYTIEGKKLIVLPS